MRPIALRAATTAAGKCLIAVKGVEIPEPDYDGARTVTSHSRPLGRSQTFNASGLHPKSPESKARQDLHREMMMNKKL